MNLSELKPAAGSTHSANFRVGRGHGSGNGKTAGKGHKGQKMIAEMGFPVLSTRLPDSKKFRRDLSEERKSVFRSTIFPMDTSLLKGSGIREFSEEISDIIRPQ